MKPWEKNWNTQQLKPWEKNWGNQSSTQPNVNSSQSIDEIENRVAIERAIENENIDVPADLAVTQGIYRGLGADLLGAPVDLTTMALNAGGALLNKILGVNINPIQNPVGGSDWIADKATKGAEAVGYPVFDPSKIEGNDKLAYNVARFGSGAGAGGLALASRAAKVGQAVNLSKPEKLLGAKNYLENPGRQVVDDVVAGAGAGAGYDIAENIAPDSPIAQMVGAILGGGATSLGSRSAENLVKKPYNIARNNSSVKLPDGTKESTKVTEQAATMLKGLTSNPEKARTRLQDAVDLSNESNMTKMTTGMAADDVGLGSFEVYQRNKNKIPYLEKDQAIRTDVSDSISRLENPNADVEIPQVLASKQKDFELSKSRENEVNVRKKLTEAELQRDDIELEMEEMVDPIRNQKGRKAEASKALNEQIGKEGALGERTTVKNQKFDEAAGDQVTDISPISESLNTIQSKISKLSIGEDSGLPSDFKVRVRDLAEKGEEVPLKDITGLRKNISTAISKARKAGNLDTVDNLSQLKKDINEMIDNNASFEDAQKYYKEEYAPFFGEGYGKKFRDTVQRGEGVDVSDSGNIAKIFLEKTPDAAKDLKRIVDIAPDSKAANEAVENYMAASLANDIGNKASPRTINNWIKKNAAQLDQFPEIKQKFVDLQRKIDVKKADKDSLQYKVSKFSQELRNAEKDTLKTERRIEKGILGSLINSDPDKYVGEIMNSKDRLKRLDEVNQLIGKNVQAKEGFKKAVTKKLLDDISGTNVKMVDGVGESPILYNKIANIMKKNEDALVKVYSPKEMNAIRRAQKVLSQYGNLARKASEGSNTAEKLTDQALYAAAQAGLRLKFGVLKAGGIMKTLKDAALLLPPGNMSKAEQLLSRAMLDPEVAIHLLDTPTNMVNTPRWNKRLSQLLGVSAAARESLDGEEEK